MSNSILIIGESGSGKSTSIRTLDPKETFIINVLDKPLPFKGFKKLYKPFGKDTPEGNYYCTDKAETIVKLIQKVNSERLEIKNLIIDDWQYVMANDFMRKALEKGYEKFSLLGKNAWETINAINSCRPDLLVFVLSHSDTDIHGRAKCKTIGKMLEDKICIEGMFTTVLHAITQEGRFKFLTQNDGMHLAKAPMGMFPDSFIDNDLAFVKQQMQSYFDEDIQQ